MTLLPQCLSRPIFPLRCYNTTTTTATRTIPISICSLFHHIPPHPLLFLTTFPKPASNFSPFSLYVSGSRSVSHAAVPDNNLRCQVLAEDIASSSRVKVHGTRLMTVESLRLVPVGEKLISYFAERKISKDVLQRNAVMQISGDQNAIAFTYRRNEVLVACKYRSLDKKFWQEKCTEKILYGLNDINGADEVIIVKGEIDKLSMEEAGFLNCVSVPDGAPQKVSAKLPSLEKDSGFQYLRNCKEHLDKDKVSRIILATDGDPPGNALAEELVRRLGKERCWRVCWPKKGELSYYKDANEVLMNLGSAALRDVVHSAEPYFMHD